MVLLQFLKVKSRMIGLRTEESKKFNKFFELVQYKAKLEDKIFFLDSGKGNDFENEFMEGENLLGWLVPLSKASEFEKLWEHRKEDEQWIDFYCWAEWFDSNGEIDVRFITIDIY
jgi:hypothetical protein